jgi:hypothetical protein
MTRSSREDGAEMTTKGARPGENSAVAQGNEGLEREKRLTPEARRALAEAAARRAASPLAAPADEIGGRGGLEPTRYGDWERKGLASDF